MKRLYSPIKTLKILGVATAALCVGVGAFASFAGRATAAACVAPSTDYGNVTTTISAPSATTYRIWSRIMVPDTTSKTYLLQVDGTTCYTVGGGSIAASTWTWVDYQSGITTNKVQQSLTQGSHPIKLIGNAPGVKVDRVIALSDLACVPTGLGDNCNVPSDTTPPTVTLTAPLEAAIVTGSVPLTATATDGVGVTKVEFYDNSTLIAADTSSPYSVTWNSVATVNGSHLITARAYDAAGNVSSDSSTVTTKNGDSQAPSIPTNVKATASSYNTVAVSWTASTDNTAVTGYTIVRDGVPVNNVGAVTSYTDTPVSAHTSYSYQVLAYDAAGNKSTASAKVTVQTPNVADSQAPSIPTELSAVAASPTQINLNWTASTDNIGVVSYDVYRSTGGGDPTIVGTSTTPSFGDPSLSASTTYAYYVVAKDASGNASAPSATVTATTAQPPTQASVSSIVGTITKQGTDKPIPYARVVIPIDGVHHVYQADRFGRYAIFNLPVRRYNLTFRAKGYYSKTVAVQLDAVQLTQDISLKKRSR